MSSMRGQAARITWGYYDAATLAHWQLDTNAHGGGLLTGTVVQADSFRVSQRPVTFVVDRPRGPAWQWPILSLQVSGSDVQATLGPQE